MSTSYPLQRFIRSCDILRKTRREIPYLLIPYRVNRTQIYGIIRSTTLLVFAIQLPLRLPRSLSLFRLPLCLLLLSPGEFRKLRTGPDQETTRMEDIEDDKRKEHKHGVEGILIRLVAENRIRGFKATAVFDETEDIADLVGQQNSHSLVAYITRGIKHTEMRTRVAYMA